MTKQCKSCGHALPLTAFSKHAMMRDGRLNYCKPCIYGRTKTNFSRSPEARAAAHRRWRVRQGLPEYAPRLSEAERLARRRVSSRNYSRRKVGTPLSAPVRDDQGRTPEYYRARRAAREMKRIADKKQRTPLWLNQAHFAEIEGLYHFAKVMGQITGRKYHVDHIEPLRGQDVSGLHAPQNLQVILAQENFRKGNRRRI